jgi:hypothetical protein
MGVLLSLGGRFAHQHAIDYAPTRPALQRREHLVFKPDALPTPMAFVVDLA